MKVVIDIKTIKYLRHTMFIPILATGLIILAFIADTPEEIFNGYLEILKSPSILITDYVSVGGLGATLFNAGSILWINLLLINLLRVKVDGPVFAGLMAIVGFSFFGKNLFNTLPIYFGIFLFSFFKKEKFNKYIVFLLFSTGISPLVSYCMFGMDLELYIGIPLGVVSGVAAGFFIPSFSIHTSTFHHGFNLFNTGFALGIISLLFHATFVAFGREVNTVYDVNNSYSNFFLIFVIILSLIALIYGIISKVGRSDYVKILKTSGRLVADYVEDFDSHAVFINIGSIGLLLAAFCYFAKIEINGPIFGTIITVMGFAAFGVHLFNYVPVMIGAVISIPITGNDFTQVSIIIAVFFASGLSPITGHYGIIAGIIAGFIHMIITPLMISFQGGFDLYNNGFSAGFVAALLGVFFEIIRKNRDVEEVKEDEEDYIDEYTDY